MNSVTLVGRLTKDPVKRATPSGVDVTTMRLAVPRRPKNGSQQPPVYIDIAAFSQLAVICGEHLAKGRQVAITGRLEYSQWTDERGGRHSKHEVIADEVNFLDQRPASDEGPSEVPEPAEPAVAA